MNYAARIAPLSAAVVFTLFSLLGCASPPSVAPLLRSADLAITQEQQLLNDDSARRSQWFAQQRDALAGGFEADLNSQPQLDSAWVLEGVHAYTAACELLLRHELDLQQQTKTRGKNLQQASAAIRRAVGLIEQQDQLFQRIPDLRRWMESQK